MLATFDFQQPATGFSESGMAVEEFDLDLAGRDLPDWSKVEADVVSGLAHPGALKERLAKRAYVTRLPRRPGAAKVAPPRVLINNDATPRADDR
jgi:hypothetical protein